MSDFNVDTNNATSNETSKVQPVTDLSHNDRHPALDLQRTESSVLRGPNQCMVSASNTGTGPAGLGAIGNKRERDDGPRDDETGAQYRARILSSKCNDSVGTGLDAGISTSANDYPMATTEFDFENPDAIQDAGRDVFRQLQRCNAIKSPCFSFPVSGPGGSKCRLRVYQLRWRLEHEHAFGAGKSRRVMFKTLCMGQTSVVDPDKPNTNDAVSGLWVPPARQKGPVQP